MDAERILEDSVMKISYSVQDRRTDVLFEVTDAVARGTSPLTGLLRLSWKWSIHLVRCAFITRSRPGESILVSCILSSQRARCQKLPPRMVKHALCCRGCLCLAGPNPSESRYRRISSRRASPCRRFPPESGPNLSLRMWWHQRLALTAVWFSPDHDKLRAV